MKEAPSHERPILLLVNSPADVAGVMARFLQQDEVRYVQLPSPWVLEEAGVGPEAMLGSARSLSLDALGDVVDGLRRVCDSNQLEQACRLMWPRLPEAVRDYYLERGTLKTMAAIFKLAPASKQVAPPASFHADRAKAWALPFEYRLAREGEAIPGAPAEEATLTWYPFDPTNAAARADASLDAGSETILEVFAYESGRARHRALVQAFAAREGLRMIDPLGEASA